MYMYAHINNKLNKVIKEYDNMKVNIKVINNNKNKYPTMKS